MTSGESWFPRPGLLASPDPSHKLKATICKAWRIVIAWTGLSTSQFVHHALWILKPTVPWCHGVPLGPWAGIRLQWRRPVEHNLNQPQLSFILSETYFHLYFYVDVYVMFPHVFCRSQGLFIYNLLNDPNLGWESLSLIMIYSISSKRGLRLKTHYSDYFVKW